MAASQILPSSSSPPLSSEEAEKEALIARVSKDVHDTMKGIPLHTAKVRGWKRLGMATVPKSVIAEYRLSEEPDYVRMHVWVEDLWLGKEVMFKTQAMTVLGGKLEPLEEPLERAYTYSGKLSGWAGFCFSSANPRDAQLERLGDIR